MGVRIGTDIDVEEIPGDWLNDKGYLLPETERHLNSTREKVEIAIRNTKGMSTSISIEELPRFRKKAPMWQIEASKIGGDLEAVQDSQNHVSIMPRVTMLLHRYEMALANTQNDWERVY